MSQQSNTRIAKNTGILYLRLIITMILGLYTSRVVLNVLGVDDFGIYNVVGGVVTMFTVISGSLSAAITRYLTFELGKNDSIALKKAFSTSIIIQISLCVIVVAIAEPLGLWFMHNKMLIPSERMLAADWVFQFSLATFCLNLINIPFNAVIIAHEHMNTYAYISIYDAVAKLAVVFLLVLSPIDKLIFYAALLVLVSLSTRIIYGIYCRRCFEECQSQIEFDKSLFKQMFSFAGWNFIGVVSSVCRDTGGSVIINLFYPPAVNAARGIAIQVSNAVRSFSSNFLVAINPQITKSYAVKETEYTNKLVFSGAKLSFFLLLLIALPVICNTHYLLELWLKIVPDYAVVFVRLILVLSLIDSISETMITLMLATGNIRNYQILVGGMVLLNLPISYLFLKLGFQPQVVIVVAVAISMACIFLRITMLNRMTGLSIKAFMRDVLLKVLGVTMISCVLPYYITSQLSESFVTLIFSTAICLASSIIAIWTIGFNNSEKLLIRTILSSKFKFLKPKKHA